MKNNKKKALTKSLTQLFQEARQVLDVNQEQNHQGAVFDTLLAVDQASKILNKAWKISQKHELMDKDLRNEFVDMFSYFGKVKKEINKDLKYKH
jgi:hypothetical protein